MYQRLPLQPMTVGDACEMALWTREQWALWHQYVKPLVSRLMVERRRLQDADGRAPGHGFKVLVRVSQEEVDAVSKLFGHAQLLGFDLVTEKP